MKQDQKITCLLLHLGQGGIEQFAANLTNELVKKTDVEIVAVYKKTKRPVPELDDKIKVRYVFDFDIGARRRQLKYLVWLPWHYLTRNWKIGREIKRIKNGTIITTRYAHNAIVGKCAARGVTKIATEHNYLLDDENYTKSVIDSCRNMDFVVLPAKETFNYYVKRIEGAKCVRIPHFLMSLPKTQAKLDGMSVVSLGRLAPEKGYDDLIEVFGRVTIECPDATLHILGEGEERERLSTLAARYDVKEKVMMPGHMGGDDVKKCMLGASVFVSTSHMESFGLAALEAMAYGLPVVTFDSARGILDYLEDGKNGIEVKNRNHEQMAKDIVKLLKNKRLRSEMGARARASAEAYSAAKIMPLWWELLDDNK
ncbi:MAG: glycosyltransferase [Candidatus Saccharimonadales bacterium]